MLMASTVQNLLHINAFEKNSTIPGYNYNNYIILLTVTAINNNPTSCTPQLNVLA